MARAVALDVSDRSLNPASMIEAELQDSREAQPYQRVGVSPSLLLGPQFSRYGILGAGGCRMCLVHLSFQTFLCEYRLSSGSVP